MNQMKKVVDSLMAFTEEIMHRSCKVSAVTEYEDGWKAVVEVIEEDEYMRRRARKDLVGIYEIIMDSELKITSYQRKELRERGSIIRE